MSDYIITPLMESLKAEAVALREEMVEKIAAILIPEGTSEQDVEDIKHDLMLLYNQTMNTAAQHLSDILVQCNPDKAATTLDMEALTIMLETGVKEMPSSIARMVEAMQANKRK